MSDAADFAPQSTTDAVSRVSAAVSAGDVEGAAQLAEQAISSGYIHPALYNAQALWLERQGRDEEALGLYLQARGLTLKDARLLNAVGLCLIRLARLDEAIATFDEAIRTAPAYALSHHRKGMALGFAGHWDLAQRAHARAAQLDPAMAEALASVAAIAARKGDERTARAHAERALKLEPANATAHVALALVEIAHGDFRAAEARLTAVTEGTQLMGHGRAVALGILGDALDGQDKTSEAFEAYTQANLAQLKVHARYAGRPRASETVELALSELSARREDWQPAGHDVVASGPPRIHSFLLGFPRSGTTLLEQALESHEDVVTLEEHDLLADFAERYLSTKAGLDQLAQLEGHALGLAREAYWQRLRDRGIDVDGKAFVDKNPLNTIKLPLIAKLFPGAKIILAVRDPRDVVLSCFRRHLDVDQVKYELLTLDGAAHLYDSVMRLGDACRTILPLAFFENRYEDLVADFDHQTLAICEFLGIAWHESMRDFANTARALDSRHASAGQVRRGLYDEGAGQWRRYEQELSPILPVLQRWVTRFGYD